MNKTTTIIIAVLAVILVIGATVALLLTNQSSEGVNNNTNKPTDTSLKVTSYDECVTAGYPIKKSNPPQCTTPDGLTFTQTTTPVENKDNLIRLESPQTDALVQSPLTVRGQARGTWYFEATFPVKLIDANGKVLVAQAASAQSNWMTEDFVPFTSTLLFPTPSTTTGWLILSKDNPSDLPVNADELKIPVRFR